MKEAIRKYNEADLKNKMMNSSKLKNSEMYNEKCELKSYLRDLSVNDVRHIFKNGHQFVKMNYIHESPWEMRQLPDLYRQYGARQVVSQL